MKRTLRHLDPTVVMPSRVKKMLDTLTEGVILMDTDEHIILANTAFAKEHGFAGESIMGMKVSELARVDHQTKKPYDLQPWLDALFEKQTQIKIKISLRAKEKKYRTYQANFSPILDDKEHCHGALATFDDITELEILASQDPLTGCLNRRAFFTKAGRQFKAAYRNGATVSCIMGDIDLFKSINDTYGHVVGDRIIQYFAGILFSAVKGDDSGCRYGGEEFCIFLHNCTLENALVIAERMRARTEDHSIMTVPENPGLRISASFGVSTLDFGAESLEELINQADKALYVGKDRGRNRVVYWKLDTREKRRIPAL